MFVDGIPRVVCGVTEETTCQEVVIALAQALGMYALLDLCSDMLHMVKTISSSSSLSFYSLGQAGRYTLREKFKDFERCMSPSERLLETLEKYGEQAREVQLSLHHNGPSVWDEMSRTKIGRYQPCPPMRRKDAGTRIRRGSGSLSMHRQSLPLSCLRQEDEKPKEDLKKPKRKSLTLMEEAWEWLEGLGKGKVYSTACEKENSKRTDKKNRTSLDVFLSIDKDSGRGNKSKVRGQKSLKSDLDHQTSCCMGSHTRGKEHKHSKTTPVSRYGDLPGTSCATTEAEKNSLRETIICQLSHLQDLQDQIAQIDKQILELEEQQRAKRVEQEAQQRAAEEEMEQIKFWENELKAEEGYEKDLQMQFLEMKAKALECKPKLEECKRKIEGLDFVATQRVLPEGSETVSKHARDVTTANGITTVEAKWKQSDPKQDVNSNRKSLPHEDFPHSPHALVAPVQIKERRPTGPTELREWWTRWSQAQTSQSQIKKKVIHRSELTIYLGSTKV